MAVHPDSSRTSLRLDVENGAMKKEQQQKLVDAEGHVRRIFVLEELYELDFWRAIWGEFLGTFFFHYMSIGGVMSAINIFTNSGALHTFVIVFHMILILICIYAFSNISGAHFNPAVTFATLLTQRVTFLRFGLYLIAQLCGSLAGSGLAVLGTPHSLRANYGMVAPVAGANTIEVIIMEFTCTFGLVFGAYALAFDPRGWGKLGPIGIAMIVGVNAHVAAFVTGGALNPLRAFAPAAIHGRLHDSWKYILGDMLGGALGGVTYEYTFMKRTWHRPWVPNLAGEHPKQD